MPTEYITRSYEDECRQIIDMVFATMLDLNVTPAPVDSSAPANMLTAAIYFAGSWQGAVLLECTQHDACTFAERLMSIPRPDVFNEDVRDSLSELVNMIGGNLKAALPRGAALSMPSVIEGRQYSLRLQAKVVTREAFSIASDPIWVTLVEMPDAN